jgi:hypothetical protein
LCSTLWDEQNYVSFAYVFKKLTYYCFNSSLSFCSSWIYRVNPTGVVSSISSLRCRLSSGWRRQAATPCHTSFPSSQDELTTSASSSGDASSRHLPSRAETEVLNLHHRHWPPSSAIKKSSQPCHSPHHSIVSPFYLLPSQSIMPSELHTPPLFPFTVILCPSSLNTMIPTWRTGWPSFTSKIAYRYVNSRKKIF